MNKCHFMGRLVRDPEIRYTQSDQPVPVAYYTLAVDRRIKREGEPSADFLDFVAYGKAAEFTEKYLKKGIKVVVTARCGCRSYEKDGKKIYVIEFIIEDQEFAESKRAAEGKPASNDFMQIPDGEQGELPFN
jgi:single-strand DNA-binding protein